MTSKNKTSLTRQALLERITIETIKADIEGFGVVYLRPLTELKRSQRASQMFGHDGKIKESEWAKRRVYAIVDQVCEEDGTPLFAEKDVRLLLEQDSIKIDPLYAAIEHVFGAEEGNDQAESSD